MSNQYTTGEIAKLCGVSVRTVQYYDDRKILVPSALSEGGRRLYSENDLKRMHIICFLRTAGLPINSISVLLEEENPEKIISVLLEQQEQALSEELAELQAQLDMIEGIKRELRELDCFSVESIGDIAYSMNQKAKRKKMLWLMVLTGIPVTALLWTAIVLWITHGFWWLFVIWALIAISWGVAASRYYYNHTSYICPACHELFRPGIKEVFWAYHTPKMRRLTCPKCGRRGLCLEVYDDEGRRNNS